MKKIAAILFLIIVLVSCKKGGGGSETVASPEITGINPNTGTSGDVITLSGKNFKPGSSVLFGSVVATISSITSTEIKATVPAGTGIVQVQVQSGSLKSNAVPFNYSTSTGSTPSITSLQSVTSITGDTLTINGNNFTSTSKIHFGTTEIPVLSFTPVKITAILPVGSGTVAVSVKNTETSGQVTQSNQLNFTFASVSTATISIGGIPYKVDTLSYNKIGPGTNFLSLSLTEVSGTKSLKVFLTTIDGTNQYIDFKPVVGRDSVSNTERVASMAARKSVAGSRYIAGTNSDYWEDNGYQRNVNMIDGVLASMGDNRTSMGYSRGNAIFDRQKRMYIDNLIYSASATFGTQTITVDTINYFSYLNPDNLIFFNIYCGKTTGTNNARTEVAVTPVSGTWNYLGETSVKVVEVYQGKGNNAVSSDISILSGATGNAANFLNQLQKNDVLKVNFNLTPRRGGSFQPYNVTGGWQTILRDGTVLPDLPTNGTQLHPRTGIGFSNNGTKVYMCVIDGRNAPVSIGVVTSGLGEIMKYYGATDALNLDGGGSSTMYLDKIGVVNVPSDGAERSVASGIFAVSSAPDDNQITEIVPKQYTVRLTKGTSFTPVFYGLNKYGQVINTNLTGVTIYPNGLGNFSGGIFTAGNTNGYGFVAATYNNLSTRIKVIIE